MLDYIATVTMDIASACFKLTEEGTSDNAGNAMLFHAIMTIP